MKRVPTGTLIAGPSLGGETVRAFVPTPLPPDPELTVDIELREEIDQALLALGRLDSVSSLLPDTSLFLYMYVRKEDRERIQELGRITGSALQVHYALQQHPIQTINSAKERTGLSVPTVTAVMKSLEGAGVVRELTGKQRYRRPRPRAAVRSSPGA